MFGPSAEQRRGLLAVLVVSLTACGRFSFDRGGTDATESDTAGGEWRLAQAIAINLGNQVSIQPTSAGNLVIVAVTLGDIADSVVQITDDAGNTYTGIPSTRSENIGAIEIWYAENVAANTRLITVDSGALKQPNAVVVWDVENMRRVGALDTAIGLSGQPATTVVRAPQISTAADGDFVVAVTKVETKVIAIQASSGFVDDSLVQADGWSHLADARAPAGTYQAVWDTMVGTYCASVAAFYAAP